MKSLIIVALMSLMMAGCARPATTGPTPHATVVSSEPAPIELISVTPMSKKEVLCAKAIIASEHLQEGMRREFSSVVSHVVACEVGETLGYFIVTLEQMEDETFIRKLDIMYLFVFVNNGWQIHGRELILRDGTVYEDREMPLEAVPGFDPEKHGIIDL